MVFHESNAKYLLILRLWLYRRTKMTKIWYYYSGKRNPEGFLCLGIKEEITLLHKLLGYYKKVSFQFLTLNTLSKYAPLVQPINFQGYLGSEEQKKCFSWEKTSFVATRKEFFLLELLQTVVPIQLEKLKRVRHYMYQFFKNTFKIQFDSSPACNILGYSHNFSCSFETC